MIFLTEHLKNSEDKDMNRPLLSPLLANLAILAFTGLVLAIIVLVATRDRMYANVEYKLHGEISVKSAEKFRQFMLERPKNSKYTLHIESFGGVVLSHYKILHYLKYNNTTVSCVVDSHAMSAAAIILTHCDNINVTSEAKILFHIIQICKKKGLLGCTETGAITKKDNPESYKESIHILQSAKKYLTAVEWMLLLNGANITIKGDEFMRRVGAVQ